MNRPWTLSAGCALALLASLALARVHPFGDAGLYRTAGGASSLGEQAQFPPKVRAILEEKCADCHSNRTRTPFYGRFAPVSWLMERDIEEGRKAMNLSEWDRDSPDRQQVLAAKIVQETKAGRMPLPQYRAVHWKARLSEDDLKTLGAWGRGPAAQAGAASNEGDPARGKEVFEKRCTGCHSLTQNREGPRLQGVYGRASGSAQGFAYSPALVKAGVLWNEDTLERWLTDPDAFVPGNNMDFHVAKAQERADLIRYLKQTSGR
jgi:cytochrome c